MPKAFSLQECEISWKDSLCKDWNENKMYCFEERDFIQGNFEVHQEIPELKFPTEVEEKGTNNCEMYSFGDRLLRVHIRYKIGKKVFWFCDTNGKSIFIENTDKDH